MQVGDKEIRLSSEQLSQRLLGSVRDPYFIPDALSYELSAVAPSLFFDDGQMRKHNKADLMNELLKPGKVECFPAKSYHVVDGSAWLYHTSWPKIGKISDLYQMFLQGLIHEAESSSNVTVCFDYYELERTKGPEQKRRRQNFSTTQIDVKINTPIPSDRQKFLSDKGNKQKLVDLFSSLLVNDGITVKHAFVDGDADTLIVKESLNKAHDCAVSVHSFDTDVFITLLYHYTDDMYDIHIKTKKGVVSMKKIAATMDDELQSCLLFCHAISGCDTVSATFGIGKLKAFRILKQSPYWLDLITDFGTDNSNLSELVYTV